MTGARQELGHVLPRRDAKGREQLDRLAAGVERAVGLGAIGRFDGRPDRRSAVTCWVTANSILLESFGQGGRLRSDYTNSGGGARTYRLFLEWQTVIAEGGSNDLPCADELAVTWRSKFNSGAPDDLAF